MTTPGSVYTSLFLYSMAMFTFPFIGYFLTRHVVEYLGGGDFITVTVSVIAAVVIVHIIIIMYVWQAFKEARHDYLKESESTKKD